MSDKHERYLMEECNKLQEQLDAKDKEINELKKKRSKGEINEAFAVTIENNKDEISKLKAKNNKLSQKLDAKDKEIERLHNQKDKAAEKCNDRVISNRESYQRGFTAGELRLKARNTLLEKGAIDALKALTKLKGNLYQRSEAIEALKQLQNDESLEVEE